MRAIDDSTLDNWFAGRLPDGWFAGHVGFEHENDPAEPLPGLAESVGYTKGTIAGLA